MTVPATKGYYMPAEWHPHERCWMAWPCRDEIWNGRIEDARQAYARVARAIAEFEPVTIVANANDVVAASLACGRGVDVLPMAIDDSWMRDIGPTYVVDGSGQVAGCDWHFNGWGNKYDFYNNDARLAELLLAHQGIPRLDAPFVLEGGAIHTDGEGTLLTTESVLLNPNRNPGMDRQDVEQCLRDWLGVEKIIWLPGGYHADETDGHVDNVACFAAPGVVLAASCPERDDPNCEMLAANIEILRSSTDARGRRLTVLAVDQPSRMEDDGDRQSRSYVNLYIANGAVVMPTFEDRRDNAAYRTVAQAFPDHEVVRVRAMDIVRGGGGIHCITQQQPKAGRTS